MNSNKTTSPGWHDGHVAMVHATRLYIGSDLHTRNDTLKLSQKAILFEGDESQVTLNDDVDLTTKFRVGDKIIFHPEYPSSCHVDGILIVDRSESIPYVEDFGVMLVSNVRGASFVRMTNEEIFVHHAAMFPYMSMDEGAINDRYAEGTVVKFRATPFKTYLPGLTEKEGSCRLEARSCWRDAECDEAILPFFHYTIGKLERIPYKQRHIAVVSDDFGPISTTQKLLDKMGYGHKDIGCKVQCWLVNELPSRKTVGYTAAAIIKITEEVEGPDIVTAKFDQLQLGASHEEPPTANGASAPVEKELDPAEVERRAHREALDVVAELIRRGDVTELDELYRICPNIVDQAIEIYKLA